MVDGSGGKTNVEELVKDIVGDVPEVTNPEKIKKPVIETNDSKPKIPNSKVALTDKYGRTFDSSIHATNTDGSPKLNKNLKHITIKKGYHSKPSSIKSNIGGLNEKSQTDSINSNDSSQSLNDSHGLSAREAANIATSTLAAMGVMLGGTDWNYIKNDSIGLDESASINNAFNQYFESTGIVDIPPGTLLAITLLSYAIPRFMMTKTQSRVKKVLTWIKSKRSKLTNGPRIDSREKSERKVNTSKKDCITTA